MRIEALNLRFWLSRSLFCALALLFSSVIPARADFQAGKRAYEQGDYATALEEFTALAEHGDADAQVFLGKMYLKGQGVSKDAGQAFKWFKAAAEQRNAEGQFYLGSMCFMGIGMARDTPQALKWLHLSAEQGMPDAQLLLGMAYMRGRDAPRDVVQAEMWLHLAAAQRDPLASKLRDKLEEQMTPDQIAKARALAAAWKPKTTPSPNENTKK